MKLLDRLEELAHNAKLRRLDFAQEMHDIIDELRPYFEPSDSLYEQGAPEMSAHFRAWSAICDVMREVGGPDWSSARPIGTVCPRDAAVAAIRSMAAQCSAQSAQVIPIAWPEPVAREQLDVLQWTIGYFQGCGYVDAAKSIDVTLKWLQKNGCDQIR